MINKLYQLMHLCISNKGTHFVLSIILILTISACGGSSGNNTPPTTPINPPPSAGNPSPTGPAVGSLITLEAIPSGTCVNVIDEANGLEYLRVMSCNEEHQYQVAGTYDLNDFGLEFPGRIALERVLHQGCRAVFENHTGQAYTGRGLGIQTISPSRSSWDDGDRTVICLIMNADRSALTQSVVG